LLLLEYILLKVISVL